MLRFAGQQETFLNVQGFDAVLVAVKHVFASLFNDRAILLSRSPGIYDHLRGVALAGACGGWFAPSRLVGGDVLYRYRIRLTGWSLSHSAWGLGEMVVQGAVSG